MAKAADPKSVADMDPVYEKLFRAIQKHAAANGVADSQGGRAAYFRPPGWAGDPHDYAALAEAFSRDKANQHLVDAIKDHLHPGTTGDVVACSIMINMLSVMGRAFAVRHTMRRCRAAAHAAGRKIGHGSDKGVPVQLGIEYVRAVLRRAKDPQT